MDLTKEQLSELICKHSERENGLQDLLEILLESMMVSERREYLRENSASGNKCNGFRPGHSYGHGRTLTFRIPRDRMGIFILGAWRSFAIRRMNANVLSERFTRKVLRRNRSVRYSRISMASTTARRAFCECWTTLLSLEAYYPIVFIDCGHMRIHRKRNVETGAFCVVLTVREGKRREVLGIFNKPTESALGWGEMLTELHERGVRKIGLVCADGLKGLEDVISAIFPGTPLQRCTTHLKRNLLSCVRNGDKGELAEDLRQLFRTGDRSYTVERA